MIEHSGLLQKYGKIDVVVSNAAANPSVDSILQTKDSVLDKLWEINVKATILLLKVINSVKWGKQRRTNLIHILQHFLFMSSSYDVLMM